MNPLISIVICTHNPKKDFIERVLQALEKQTLSKDVWELLLVDNASDRLLSQEINLDWHPQANHIREERLGLTPARLRGIQESKADVLIFVDDDNVLAEDYLDVALRIGKEFPFIGAWGGQTLPEFEEAPPEWTKLYWWMLALYQFDKDHWSNIPHSDTNPCGAGICVRKTITEKYASVVSSDSTRSRLDRTGNSLTCCGDTDLAFTAYDLGFGTGKFVDLKLIHLMTSKRLQESYLLKLAEGNGYSELIFESLRNEVKPYKATWKHKLYESYRRSKMSPVERRMCQAKDRGKQLAMKELFNAK